MTYIDRIIRIARVLSVTTDMEKREHMLRVVKVAEQRLRDRL